MYLGAEEMRLHFDDKIRAHSEGFNLSVLIRGLYMAPIWLEWVLNRLTAVVLSQYRLD